MSRHFSLWRRDRRRAGVSFLALAAAGAALSAPGPGRAQQPVCAELMPGFYALSDATATVDLDAECLTSPPPERAEAFLPSGATIEGGNDEGLVSDSGTTVWSVTNAGSIRGEATSTGIGIALVDPGSQIVNRPSGKIFGETAGVAVASDALILNAGTIKGNMFGVVAEGTGLTLENQGEIVATGTDDPGDAIAGVLELGGGLITNAGLIAAGSLNGVDSDADTKLGIETLGSDSIVFNTGTVRALGDEIGDQNIGVGIDSENAVVFNDGDVEAVSVGKSSESTGIFGREPGALVANSGQIRAESTGQGSVGVGVGFVEDDGQLINAGSILTLVSGGSPRFPQSMAVVLQGDDANVSNTGTIESRASSAGGLGAMGVYGHGERPFVDNDGGEILADGTAVHLRGDDAILVNRNDSRIEGDPATEIAGTGSIIDNRGTMIGRDQVGVRIDAMDAMLVNASTGRIEGDIGVVANPGLPKSFTMINAGTIAGRDVPGSGRRAIEMGSGANVLELWPGSDIRGTVVAEGSDNQLVLGGNGAETLPVGRIGAVGDGRAGGGQYLGFQSLEKTGSALWRLTGTNAGLQQDLAIDDGILQVDADIPGVPVSVNGGILRGTGRIGGLDMGARGVIYPGNSVGEIGVDGDARFRPGSVYLVRVDNDGTSSSMTVAGDLIIDGGTVEAAVERGDSPSVLGSHRIASVTGDVDGRFDGVGVDHPLIEPSLTYGDQWVDLVLAFDEPMDIANTSNQRQVASVLNSMNRNAPGYAAFEGTLLTLDGASLPAALEGLAGTDAAAMAREAPSATAGLLDFLSGATGAPGTVGQSAQFAPGTVQFASTADTTGMQQSKDRSVARLRSFADEDDRPAVWTRLTGRTARWGESADTPGTDTRATGLQAGVEIPATPRLTVGVALGYEEGQVSTGSAASTDTQSVGGALYGRYRDGGLRLSGALSYSRTGQHSRRFVPAFGVQSASYQTDAIGMDAEAAYDLAVEDADVTVAPLAGMRFSLSDREGYTERGAVGLTIDGASSSSVRSRLGVEISLDGSALELDTDAIDDVNLTGRLAWSRELGSPEDHLTASLFESDSFRVEGRSQPRDMATVGQSLDVPVSQTAEVFAGYGGRFGDQFAEHSGRVGATLQW